MSVDRKDAADPVILKLRYQIGYEDVRTHVVQTNYIRTQKKRTSFARQTKDQSIVHKKLIQGYLNRVMLSKRRQTLGRWRPDILGHKSSDEILPIRTIFY